MEELTAGAPLVRDFLCGACKAHDEAVRELLAGVGVEWEDAPRLVRGLDYYQRTTFEWQAGSLDAAQNALGGGGRYDGLSEALGGPPAPGIGWALGLDRTVLALEQAGRLPADPWRLDALVLPLVPAARLPAQRLVRDLRRARLVADLPYADRTLNGHMKAAAKAGARTVVILGEQELAAGQAAVRDMAAREQHPVPLDEVRGPGAAGRRRRCPMTRPLLGAMRSHGCGTLRAADAGIEVRLAGWVARRRDHGGVAFLDLRDASGVVQVVVHPDQAQAAAIRAEDCVRVAGTVRARPAGNENPELPTGEVEVAAADVEVLAPSETPPFPLEGRVDADETLRLQYRYLDLRRPAARRGLEIRARANATIRRVLEERAFLEVETPYLTKSTPEGARDFLVTTHLAPGQFYALPQSPQLFKQLLMVAGVERYYQIVRCFRDEALRADRQPEFTQLDLELSFLDEEDVYALGEELMAAVWGDVLGEELTIPFERLTYAEAMRRFGTDKPDLRYGMELVDLGPVFAGTGVGVFAGALEAKGSVLGLRVEGGGDLTRKQLDALTEQAKARGAKGLAWVAVEPQRPALAPGQVLHRRRARRPAEGHRRPAGRPAAAGRRPHPGGPDRPRRPAGPPGRRPGPRPRGPLGVRVGDRVPHVRVGRAGPPLGPGPPSLHRPGPQVGRHLHGRPPGGHRPRLRPGPERLRARVGQHPYPPRRRPAPRLRGPRHRPRGGRGPLRLLPQGPGLRRPPARRLRLRPRPPLHAPRRHPLHPRRHHLPQDPVRRRPPHRRPHPHPPRPARRGPPPPHRPAGHAPGSGLTAR